MYNQQQGGFPPPPNFGQQPQQQMQQQQYQAPAQNYGGQPPVVNQPKQEEEGTAIKVNGRIVWGHLGATQKKQYGTNDFVMDPKTGQPVIEYVFGLAVPKNNPQLTPEENKNFQDLWTVAMTEAGKLGYQWGQNGFSFKMVDGDGRKDDGSEYPSHSKGCFIITCSTRIAIKTYDWQGGVLVQVPADTIKTGDWVTVQLKIAGHKPPKPGLYMNPLMVARYHIGEAIVNSVNPNTVFTAQPQTPTGAASMGTPPLAPNFGMPNTQQQGYQQPQGNFAPPPAPNYGQPPVVNQQQGYAQQPMQQQAPLVPDYGMLPQHLQPQGYQQQAPVVNQQQGYTQQPVQPQSGYYGHQPYGQR